MAEQSDGKILIAGQLSIYNGTNIFNIARLNADGSIDNTFKNSTGTGTNGPIFSVYLQQDGKILIRGMFSNFNGTARTNIARLNADGSLDTSFDAGTASTGINCVLSQSDGKVIVAGTFTSFNGNVCKNLIRLNADGSVDATYNTGTGPNNSIYAMTIQGDGKVIIGGSFSSYNGTSQNYLSRINTDGSLDTGFNSGSVENGSVVCITIQSDGKALICRENAPFGGTVTDAIERLNTDGTLDASFSSNIHLDQRVQTMSVQSDGKIIIGGKFTKVNGVSRNSLDRINSDGSEDMNYNAGTGANDKVESIVVQPDGKILIGGFFTRVNGYTRNGIARLNSDGSLDLSFDPGFGANGYVSCVALQTDGKIMIGGEFNGFNGSSRYNIARLNSDGSLDATFSSGTWTDQTVHTIVIQADDKIVVGGDFTMMANRTMNRIARLNSDGTVDDTGFNIGTGFDGTVYSIVLQPDGKILAAGIFGNYDGTQENVVARLNADGSVDTGFNAGPFGGGNILTILLQNDGKIILGGQFSGFNGSSIKNIVRLNADGSVDTGFNGGIGADNRIFAGMIQGDDKILIAGMLTSYDGSIIKSIARLNPDGTLDNSFTTGTGTSNTYTNYEIHSIAIQSDDNILIGGYFTSFNGTGRNRIARINGKSTSTSITNSLPIENISIYPNPFNKEIILNKIGSAQKIEIYNFIGELVYCDKQPNKDFEIIRTEGLPDGIYFVAFTTVKGIFVIKTLKEKNNSYK